MAMNKVPTLVVGIGGIGCRIAAGIFRRLTDEDKKYVGVVGVDTNENDLSKLRESGMITIRTSDSRMVKDVLIDNTGYSAWFQRNPFLYNRTASSGAGQVRMLSRLVSDAANASGTFAPIKDEITRIRAQGMFDTNDNLVVMFVGSISGGTGAGLFIQLPLYIRSITAEFGRDPVIRGMFIGGDITEGFQDSEYKKKAVLANTYTCIKELNAFYLAQKKTAEDIALEINDYTPIKESELLQRVSAKKLELKSEGKPIPEDEDLREMLAPKTQLPYDYLYLFEKNGINGSIGDANLDMIISHCADVVYAFLFTPITAEHVSIEDNLVLQTIDMAGMNRYASNGLCRVAYHSNVVEDYMSSKMLLDSTRKEWLVIDDKYRTKEKANKAERKTNPNIVELDKSVVWAKDFEDETKIGGSIAQYHNQAFYEKDSENSRSASVIDNIDILLYDGKDEIKTKADAVMVDLGKLSKNENLVKGVIGYIDSSDELADEVEKKIPDEALRVADRIFPTTKETMTVEFENQECIYNLLAKVHPVVARYFCYKIISELRVIIENTESDNNYSIATVKGNSYNYDFDDTDEVEFTPPDDAAKKLKKKEILLHKIIERKIRKHGFIEAFTDEHNKRVEKINNHYNNAVKRKVAEYLLERFTILEENYEILFETLRDMIPIWEKGIERLENINPDPNFGEISVCCSKKCLESLWNDYSIGNSVEITGEVYERLFQSMHAEYVNEAEIKKTYSMDEEKIRNAAVDKKRNIYGTFDGTVKQSIISHIREKGSSIYMMNVIDAIRYEYIAHAKSVPSDETKLQEAILDYTRNILKRAMKKASPFLAVTNAASNSNCAVFMALNDKCAVEPDPGEAGVSKSGKTQHTYFPAVCAETDNQKVQVIINDNFKESEIVCFKGHYGYVIENLSLYKDGGEGYTKYSERISKLGTRINSGDEYEQNESVTPHLDKRWHEEGFIPPLNAGTRIVHELIRREAFIYAMAMDLLRCYEDDTESKYIWWYQDACGGIKLWSKNEKYVLPGYVNVYNALPFNGIVVNMIMRYKEEKLQNIKGYKNPEDIAANILEIDCVKDLVQKTPEDGDMNLFNIFLEMRDSMKNERWKSLVETLDDFLSDMLTSLLGADSTKLIRECRVKIIDAIWNSSKLNKEEKNYTTNERNLSAIIKGIRDN